MSEKELLTKKFMLVNMDEVAISSNEKPIIGTQALSSCIAFILYNKEHKKAILGHVSCDKLKLDKTLEELNFKIAYIIFENELINCSFDLKIIEGAYKSKYEIYSHELEILKNLPKIKYNLLEVLEENIKLINYINISSVNKYQFSEDDFQIVDEYNNFEISEKSTLSKQFAFDASIGEFVTDKVYFGEEYYKINNYHTR